MNLVLIGYRGSGKTTVGRLIAEEHGCAFIDTDELIVHRAAKPIAQIFADESECGFREREKEAIQLAVSRPNRVISVGGGAVEDGENRKSLRAYGTVIWLEAPAEVLWRRIQADSSTPHARPDLAGGGLAEIQAVLNRRTPLYAETSHLVVRVSDRTLHQVMSDIEEWLAAQD